MERIDALRELVGEVLADQPVAFSYLFGSIARDEARADSDVDVAIHFGSEISAMERFDRTLTIGVDLERRTGREIDVVDLTDAPLRLQGRILTERVVLTGHRSRDRVRFETEIFPRFIDLDYHAARLDAEVLAATASGHR